MAAYGDPDTIKATTGVTADDLGSLPDTDNDADTSDEFDNLIAALNERASSLIDAYCQRDFEEHLGETVAIDGNRRKELRISDSVSGDVYYPILAVSEVRLNGNPLDPGEYRVHRDTGVIERKLARFPNGWENVEIDFDWGYSEPPAMIREVAEDLVREQLESAAASETGKGVSSISLDGFSVSFSERAQLSESHKEKLNRFARILA